MTSPLEILVIGFLLGLRHALDPDHLVAVTTIASEYRNPIRAIWVGVSWGLGHTTTLFLVGVFLLLAKVSMPERLAVFFEFVVGIVLVVLGVQILWGFRRGRVHLHPHEHEGESHAHFHSHAATPNHSHHRLSWNNLARFLIAGIIPGEHLQGGVKGSLRPFFRVKSYVVGTIHGLAGSATLMLLVLASLESQWVGMWYLLLFGLGSVGAMGLATIFLTLPFSVSTRLPRFHRLVQSATAIFSVLFGLLLMYEAALTA
jgi:ABC-type nickel/cobalt efflux system permease component RcnA